MGMTLTKAELADMLFEQVGLNKREAKATASSCRVSATSSCARSPSAPGATPRRAKRFRLQPGAW